MNHSSTERRGANTRVCRVETQLGARRLANLLLLLATISLATTAENELTPSLRWIEERGGEITRDQQARVVGIRVDLAWVTDGDIARLAKLADLKKLNLSFTLITDAGLERLSALRNVEELDLSSAELLTDAAIAHIRRWKKLRVLNLRGTDVTDTSMEYISSLPELESLDVSYTQVTNNGMEYLAPLAKLEKLSLGGNKITGAGLHILKSLPRLKHLNLGGVQKRNSGLWAVTIADSGIETVTGLKGLETLDLRGMRITGTAVDAIRKAHPACRVVWK